ncbi:MAG TPA: hypothetical protein VH591_10565 [Ktedonobacterales bacterium]|jgi:hypothetical protein
MSNRSNSSALSTIAQPISTATTLAAPPSKHPHHPVTLANANVPLHSTLTISSHFPDSSCQGLVAPVQPQL